MSAQSSEVLRNALERSQGNLRKLWGYLAMRSKSIRRPLGRGFEDLGKPSTTLGAILGEHMETFRAAPSAALGNVFPDVRGIFGSCQRSLHICAHARRNGGLSV